jgi:hypothetical protein
MARRIKPTKSDGEARFDFRFGRHQLGGVPNACSRSMDVPSTRLSIHAMTRML